MSSPSLVAFIEKLDKELQNFSSYRGKLNRTPQTFVFNKRSLFNETIKQLEAKNPNKTVLNVELKAEIKKITNEYGDLLIQKLEQIGGGAKIPRPGGKLTMVFDEDTEVEIPGFYAEKAIPVTNYTKVRLAYKDTLNEMFKALQEYLKRTEYGAVRNNDGSEKRSILGFFDSGHEDKAGVFERFLFEATSSIAENLSQELNEDSDKLLKQVQKELSDEGFKFSIQKIDDADTIVLKVESAYINRSRGAGASNFSKKLTKRIKNFLEQENLADLKGSDSLKTRKRKKVLTDLKKSFENIPGVTTSFEDLTDKKSNKTPSSIKVNSNVKNTKNTKVKGSGVKTSSTRRVKPSRNAEMLALVQQINARLPETIAKNMQLPRLRYRTGRFAGSVQVLDVNQTRQGYMSFGYTYQKNPYQTFEPGYAQGSADRDPRRLIDKSIREVAAELAIGRFYTRRL